MGGAWRGPGTGSDKSPSEPPRSGRELFRLAPAMRCARPRDPALPTLIARQAQHETTSPTRHNVTCAGMVSLPSQHQSAATNPSCTAADPPQESPHEHQQSLLLSRIITNVVGRRDRAFRCKPMPG